MKQISNSDEDDLCPPPSQVRAATPVRCFCIAYRMLVLVMFLVSLSACVGSPDDLCAGSQPTVAPPCMASSKQLTPFPPSPTSTPTSPATPAPTSVTPEHIRKTATDYLDFVLGGRDLQAYRMLSTEVRAQEPFSDFKQNHNYTLFKGCWTIDHIFVSQRDSQSGIVSIELTNVSCDDGSPIAYFDWILRLHLQHGHLVITSIGLYPTAPGN